MPRRTYRRRFSPDDYWAQRPYCSVCGERKTRSGTVCHKCREKGHSEPPPRKFEPVIETAQKPTSSPPKNQKEQSNKNTTPRTVRYPYWAIFAALACIVLAIGMSAGNEAGFITALLLLIFGVPAWSLFCYLFLNDAENVFQGLAAIAIFFWPITLPLVIWLLTLLF